MRTFDPPVTALARARGRFRHADGEAPRVGVRRRSVHGHPPHDRGAHALAHASPALPIPGKVGLAAFDFAPGTLLFTEAGTKKQASLHVVAGAAAVAAMDPGERRHVFTMTLATRSLAALRAENHTLKRVLTDPHVFSGIGNAYSGREKSCTRRGCRR